MRQTLRLHPDSRCDAAAAILVDVVRPAPHVLTLTYAVSGAIADLYLPPAVTPGRTDELWRRTCFEVFIQPPSGDTYFEFNFAPSGQWAAYRFDGYRSGMSAPRGIEAPRIERQTTGDRYELHVSLSLAGLPDLAGDGPWRLAIAAVVEETNGRASYWALTHPPGKADFHHPGGFACESLAMEAP